MALSFQNIRDAVCAYLDLDNQDRYAECRMVSLMLVTVAT